MMHWLFGFLIFIISCSGFANEPAPPLPAESSDWLDGNVVGWEQLKGKMVLLNVWTYGCWNSYRSLPWIVSLKQKFPDLQIIGVHSPEFDHEKDRNRLRKTMADYGVTYPQILDDDYKYWRQLNNRFWPSFYIVDKQGKIRGKFVGETHANDSQSKDMEKLIEDLTKES